MAAWHGQEHTQQQQHGFVSSCTTCNIGLKCDLHGCMDVGKSTHTHTHTHSCMVLCQAALPATTPMSTAPQENQALLLSQGFIGHPGPTKKAWIADTGLKHPNLAAWAEGHT
eukprot:1159808-Pelagomonas_calceolata.AAC.6